MFTQKGLSEIGIGQYGFISPRDIEFSGDIRKICEGNRCRLYAKSWACPPAVGTLDECKARCLQYADAMVFCAAYRLEDPFDYDAMKAGHGEFKKLCDRLYELVKNDLPDFLLLSNEGCARCQVCTYPDKPCKMPQMLFPSIEGFGVNVMEIAKKSGVKYNNGPNTVTYFGMLLY